MLREYQQDARVNINRINEISRAQRTDNIPLRDILRHRLMSRRRHFANIRECVLFRRHLRSSDRSISHHLNHRSNARLPRRASRRSLSGNRQVDSGKSKPQFPMRSGRDFPVTTTIYKAQRFAIAAR